MQYKIIIETDIHNVTPEFLKAAIEYDCNFRNGLTDDENDAYYLINGNNTRIISCEEIAKVNEVSDYQMD